MCVGLAERHRLSTAGVLMQWGRWPCCLKAKLSRDELWLGFDDRWSALLHHSAQAAHKAVAAVVHAVEAADPHAGVVE